MQVRFNLPCVDLVCAASDETTGKQGQARPRPRRRGPGATEAEPRELDSGGRRGQPAAMRRGGRPPEERSQTLHNSGTRSATLPGLLPASAVAATSRPGLVRGGRGHPPPPSFCVPAPSHWPRVTSLLGSTWRWPGVDLPSSPGQAEGRGCGVQGPLGAAGHSPCAEGSQLGQSPG